MSNTVYYYESVGLRGSVSSYVNANGSRRFEFKLGHIDQYYDGKRFHPRRLIHELGIAPLEELEDSIIIFQNKSQIEAIPWNDGYFRISAFMDDYIFVNGRLMPILDLKIMVSIFI